MADSVVVQNNTSLTAFFYIPKEASTGLWDMNVETVIDGRLSKENSLEILPSPALISVSPDTLNISIESGATGTSSITIHNNGASDLNFNISNQGHNYALQFDGVDDYVISKTNVGITGNQPRTISVWIYVNAFNENMTVVDWGTINWDGALCQLGVFDHSSNNQSIIFHGHYQDFPTPVGSISLSNWYHVSFTFDGYSGKIYLNGILTAESALNLNTENTQLSLGVHYSGEHDGWNRYFNGVIDELCIWNVERTQAEIQTDMYNGLTGSEPGLIGYWNFNETSGDSTFDLTANGNHGILKGGVTRIPDGAPIVPDWLSVESDMGICAVGSAVEIMVHFDARELDPGEYSGLLTLSSNDPFNPIVKIPVHMSVKSVTDKDTLLADVSPDKGYQTYTSEIDIKGVHTSFMDSKETLNVWLSKGAETIVADSVVVQSNTSLTAFFYIPKEASTGLWDMNVETVIDGLLSKENSFEILPSPALISVSPDTLNISIESGTTGTSFITIHNNGASDLNFNISNQGHNYALQFDGVDDYVAIPAISSITNKPINNFSIEAWINLFPEPTNIQQIIECNTSTWEINIETGSLPTQICMQFSLNYDINLVTKQLSEKKWHHIAGTYDGFVERLYLDGVLEDSITWSDTYTIVSGFTVGKDYESDIQYLNGMVDEVRIWDVARTQVEIQTDMYNSLTGSEPGLIGYWNFNEAAGDTAYDLTTNGNHGILKGGVTRVPDGAPIVPAWLSVESVTGICAVGSSVEIMVHFDARELDPGEYSGLLTLSSNDPFNPIVKIPVHMSVTSATDIVQNLSIPTAFNLDQNYPNPFSSKTVISYQLPVTGEVELSVYDLIGRKVTTLVKERQQTGRYEIEWDAEGIKSGIYFCKLKAAKFEKTVKLIISQ